MCCTVVASHPCHMGMTSMIRMLECVSNLISFHARELLKKYFMHIYLYMEHIVYYRVDILILDTKMFFWRPNEEYFYAEKQWE